jgi:hypothetical protein
VLGEGNFTEFLKARTNKVLTVYEINEETAKSDPFWASSAVIVTAAADFRITHDTPGLVVLGDTLRRMIVHPPAIFLTLFLIVRGPFESNGLFQKNEWGVIRAAFLTPHRSARGRAVERGRLTVV